MSNSTTTQNSGSTSRATSAKTRRQTIVRWNGFYFVGGVFLLGLFYLNIFFDLHLKSYVERIGTRLNGAQVNVGSLKTSFFRSEMEIARLEVAHHTQPMRNLLEVDRIQIKFLLGPLFRKKIVVEDMNVSGIHYRTDRQMSGTLTPEAELPMLPSAFIDRAASGFYKELRSQTSDNPLRSLGQLLNGLDVTPTITAAASELESHEKLSRFKDDVYKASEQWEKGLKELDLKSAPTHYRGRMEDAMRAPASEALPSIQAIKNEIGLRLSHLESVEKAIQHRIDTLNEYLKSIDGSVEKDAELIEDKLNLPRFDVGDLSPQIFGPRLLNWLERATYWIDFTRRRMPPGSRQDQITMVVREKSQGTSIHFGKMAAYPAILLFKARFNSNLSEESRQAHVDGTLMDITSDPPIHGKPLELSLELDLPDNKLEKGHFKLKIDHTLGNLSEWIEVKIDSLVIENLSIINSNDLKFAIQKAKGNVDINLSFQANELSAQLRTALYQVEYQCQARHRRLEKALNDLLKSSQSIDLVAKVEGQFDKLKLTASSNLGQQLSLGLEDEFKHQLAIVKDTIRRSIKDRLAPEREILFFKYKELQDKTLVPIRVQTTFLRELEKFATEKINRLQGKRNRISAKKISG